MSLNRHHILVVIALCMIGTVALFVAGKKRHLGPNQGRSAVERQPREQQAWAVPDPVPNDAHNYQDLIVREQASDSKILGTSNYRVLGKITADDALIKKWLLKKEILTRTT